MGGVLQFLQQLGQQTGQQAVTTGATTAATTAGQSAVTNAATQATTQAASNAANAIKTATTGVTQPGVNTLAKAGQTATTMPMSAGAPKPGPTAPVAPGGQLTSGSTSKASFGQKFGNMLNPIKDLQNPGRAITQPARMLGAAPGDPLLQRVSSISDMGEAATTKAIQSGGRAPVAAPPSNASMGMPKDFGTPDALRVNFGQPSDAQAAAGSWADGPNAFIDRYVKGEGAGPKEKLGRFVLGEASGYTNPGQAGGPVQPTPNPYAEGSTEDPNSPSLLELIMQLMGQGGGGMPPEGGPTGGIRG